MPEASVVQAAPAKPAALPRPALSRMPAAAPGLPAIAWNKIHRSPDLNPRKHFDDAQIAELAESIAAKGLMQNLVVRPHPKKPGEFELVAGERRHRAIEVLIKAGRCDPALPIFAQTRDLDDKAASFIALAENVARSDLTPLEEAEAFARLRKMNVPTEEIAKQIGKTQRYVQLRLALVEKLAPKAIAALRENKISAEHARELAKVDAKRQAAILDRIVPPGTPPEDEDGYAYDAIVTAEQLRFELQKNLVPVGEAVFDRKAYKGSIFVDPDDGQEFFEDPDAFNKLQTAAIEAKAKDLAKANAGGVEMVRYHGATELQKGTLPYGWKKAPKDLIAAGKAAALFAVVAGKFVVVEGLVKTEETHGGGRAVGGGAKVKKSAPEAKPDDIPVGAAREALTVRTHALQLAIAADPQHAKRIVVQGLLMGGGMARIRGGEHGNGAALSHPPAIDATLKLFEKRGLKFSADRAARWQAIAALSAADLDKIFATLAASFVSVESNYARDCWPEDDELAIAATVKADPAKSFAIGKDFLAKLKKPQLLRIVADLQLQGDPRFAKGSDAMTATVIRAVILDSGDKLKNYVPIWCRFVDEKSMRARLKSTPVTIAPAAQAANEKNARAVRNGKAGAAVRAATAKAKPKAAAKPKPKSKAKGK